MAAKKKSGKTTVIGNILDIAATKDTVVRIFSTTYEADETMKQIIKDLRKREITVDCYESLKLPEGDKSDCRDILDK